MYCSGYINLAGFKFSGLHMILDNDLTTLALLISLIMNIIKWKCGVKSNLDIKLSFLDFKFQRVMGIHRSKIK